MVTVAEVGDAVGDEPCSGVNGFGPGGTRLSVIAS